MWRTELDQAVALRPEHISAYELTIEAGTPFHAMEQQGELTLPDEEEAAGMFEQTSELLRQAGYEHYEISNFALPGRRSRHNQVYWQRSGYLGFGAGAHSFLAAPRFGSRWNNPDLPETYLQTVGSGIAPREGLSMVKEREALAEKLFLGLRMLDGVDGESFRREFGVTLEEAYPTDLPGLLAEGLLEWREGHLRLTRRGIILSNQVFIRFV
jgi:oxygen-independent coproporphyrinogen-3 oxidase